jgi:hypothetical protein
MSPRAPLLGVALALMLGAGVLAQPRKPDVSVRALVAAATQYVETYNPKMQDVLADEIAVQRVHDAGGAVVQTRTTRADFFLTYAPAETTWIAVRDVREVDNAAVNDPDNVRVLMARAPLGRLLSVIAEKNSRFNIGAITRTFNEPTLALLTVTAKHRDRFKFDRASTPQSDPGRVTLTFKERERPTLVAGTNGEQVYSTGTLVLDAGTGRIEHTTVQFTLGTISAQIETVYADNDRLKLWVPTVMKETYTASAQGFEQTVACVSTYSTYRKFETSGIIK